MTTKREFIEAIASLDMDDDIVLALTYPKPEEDEGFTLGEESDSPSDSPADDSDEDDGTIDNEDGTVTELYPEYSIDVEEVDGENENEKKKVAFINLELGDEDEDEDETEDSDPSEDN